MSDLTTLPEHFKNMTFLYVEDMTFYQSLLQQSLVNLGHVGKIHFAPRVKEAIDVINSIYQSGSTIDFIISDFHLQDGNSIDLIKKIRANKVLANIPLVIFSTDDNKQNIFDAFAAGADEYMFKPIDPEVLVEKIVFCWNKRNSKSEVNKA